MTQQDAFLEPCAASGGAAKGATMNNTILKLALLGGLGLGAATALYTPPAIAAGQVRVGVGVDIGVAPPPPRFVRAPPPRRGYVWAPGYWRWDVRAHRHVWADGYWVRARPGYRYRPAHWVRHGRQWRFRQGYWAR
jgi:hypothetical protein